MRLPGRRARSADEWGEAIAPELRELGAPTPSPVLWTRIATSRAAGERVILPDLAMTPPRSSARWWAAGALAAGVIAVLIPLGRARDNAKPAGPDALEIVSELFSANVAYGEARAFAPSAPPLDLSHADRLQPRRLQFLKTWRIAGKKTDSVFSRVALTQTVDGGAPAWLVVAQDSGSRQGRPTAQSDTVVASRGAFRLIRHTQIVQPYLRYDRIVVRQQFRGDSLVGRMNAFGADASPQGRPIARRLLGQWAPYVDDGAAPLLFGATDLHEGWTASASMVGWGVRDGDVFFPLELRVTGSERVTVPAGAFDCWRMSIRLTGVQVTMWVRKVDGIGVRVREENAGVIRENVLISEAR